MTWQGKVTNHKHADGRNCIIGPDGIWRHYDHPTPEPGPRERVDYKCDREHPCDEARRVEVGPGDKITRINPVVEESDERGEFGMPGLGVGHLFEVPDHANRVLHDFKYTFTPDGIASDFGDQGNNTPAVTQEARDIMAMVGPVMEKFLEKNAKYARAQSGHDLGAKGVIPDVNRKTAALVTAVWDGVETPSDLPTELAEDLIGHLFLLLAKMATDDG